MRFIFRLVTWVLFVAIVAMTLGPVSLRPHIYFSPYLDRFAAYAVFGIFFAQSYPQRRFWLLGAFLVIIAAGALETAQLFVPGRDAHLSDFLFKAFGATIGLIMGHTASGVLRYRRRTGWPRKIRARSSCP
jgi:hypothetical protein